MLVRNGLRRRDGVTRRMVAGVAAGAVLLAAGAACLAQPGSDGTRMRDRGDRNADRGGDRPRFGGGPFGGRNMFEPSVTSRALDSYGKILALNPDQQTAAKALLEGYEQSFSQLSEQSRERMAEMRESMRNEGEGPNPEMFRKMGEEFTKFRKAQADLESGFLNDLKAVLTPEQAEKWPTVEQMHRRETTVSRGLMSGERVDLIKTVDDMKLPADSRKALDAVLNEYSAELDRELVNRNTAFDAAQGKIRELFQDPNNAEALKAFEDGRAASMRVRDVNRKYARQVEGLLPEEQRAAFAEAFRRESFPTIYRQTYATRALNAASEISGLDDNQKATIASIRESYTRDLSAVNKDLEEAAEKRESTIKPQDLMQRRWGGGGRDDGDPLMERRRNLDSAALDKLKGVLSAEQFAALPQREGGRNRDGEGRGGEEGQGRRGRDRDERPASPPRGRTPGPGPT